jgi:hypothetical protein
MRVLKSYLFWTYERGSFHYDVMVTIILLFIFLAPRFVNFRDKPAERLPAGSEVLVSKGPGVSLVYQISAKAVDGTGSEEEFEHSLLRIIEPISGGVELDHYEPVKDANGKLVAYKVWVRR